MSLPIWYIEWVERVSNLVSFKFPFSGNAKERYLKWVYDKLKDQVKETHIPSSQECMSLLQEFPSLSGTNIWHLIDCEREYLIEAQDLWTFVHLQMELYFEDERLLQREHIMYENNKDAIEWWLTYIDNLRKVRPNLEWKAEQVVIDSNNRYQGTIDMVWVDEENKIVYLYDWKTWWIAKKRWGMPNVARKPYDKLKKLALQLSLYAETYRQKGYKIGGIFWVWLHEDQAFEYDLTIWTTEEIDELITSFYKRSSRLPPNIDLIITYNPMKIEINTAIPDMAYSNARVILEEEDIKKEGSPQKAIWKAVELQKFLLLQYSK